MKKEIVFLLTISFAFILLNVHGLTNWYYSFIGDEYSFFELAKGIAQGTQKINLLSQKGVYDYHPVLDSFYQAQIMKILGANNFG